MNRSKFVLAALCLVASAPSMLADTLVGIDSLGVFNLYTEEFARTSSGRKHRFQGITSESEGTYRIRHEASDRLLARLGGMLQGKNLKKAQVRTISTYDKDDGYLGDLFVMLPDGKSGRIQFYGYSVAAPEVSPAGGAYRDANRFVQGTPSGEQVLRIRVVGDLTWDEIVDLAEDRRSRLAARISRSGEGVPAPVATAPAGAQDDEGELLGMGGLGAGGDGPAPSSEGGLDAVRLIGAVASLVGSLN